MKSKNVIVESTPASRWVQNYKKKYWYSFGGVFIFLGLIFLIISKLFGAGLLLLGTIIIYENYKYWSKRGLDER